MSEIKDKCSNDKYYVEYVNNIRNTFGHNLWLCLRSIWSRITENDIEYVKKYIEYKLPIDEFDGKPFRNEMEPMANNNGNSLLFHALHKNREEIALLLINAGADVTYISFYYEYNLLIYAIEKYMYNIVDYCLKHNFDLKHKDKDGRNILHWAILRTNLKLITILIKDHNMDINCLDNEFNSPLIELCKMYSSANRGVINAIIRYLITHGANLDFVNKYNKTALYYYILSIRNNVENYKYDKKNIAILNMFIDYKVSLPSNNLDENNIIIELINRKYFIIVKRILILGYSMNKEEYKHLFTNMINNDLIDIITLSDNSGILSLIDKSKL